MSYAEHLDADRRLCVLRILVENEGAANESVIETALLQLGHRAGLDRDAVRGHIRHLEQTGCVTISYYRDKVMVPEITSRGVAVAEGRITVDGVAKPKIGE